MKEPKIEPTAYTCMGEFFPPAKTQRRRGYHFGPFFASLRLSGRSCYFALTDKLRSIFSPKDPQKKKNALPPQAHFSIWYFLMAFLLFSFLQHYFFSGKVETIPYSQFKQYLVEGVLSELTIGPENIKGTLKGKGRGEKQGQDQRFTTVRVNDPDLVKKLDEGKVSYSGRYENKFLISLLSWILPIGIFFLITEGKCAGRRA